MSDKRREMAIARAKEYYKKVRMLSFVAAGAAFLMFAYFTFDGAHFYLGSTVVEATVTRLDVEISGTRGGGSSASFRPHVTFLDSLGTEQTGKLGTVNGFGFEAQVGQKLQVRFNPDMLEYVRVNQFVQFWMRSIFSIGLIAVALGFALLFAKIKPNKTIIDHYLKKM